MMRDFKDWLIKKIPLLVPYYNSKIISGTYEFSIHVRCAPDISNPLNLSLRSVGKNNESVEESLRFSISEKVPDLQFVKRIRRTPVFLTSLVYNDYAIYIVDFYEWSPEVKIYRILYFQAILTSKMLEISLPANHKHLGPGKYNIGGFYLRILSPIQENLSGSTVRFPVSNDSTIENVFVFSFSMKDDTSQEISKEMLIQKLNFLISTADNNHILNDISIQDVKKEFQIDELWCVQKSFYPNRQLNKFLIKNRLSEIPDLLWGAEFAQYMGWDDILLDNKLTTSEPLLNLYDKDYQPFYDAYFRNKFETDKVIHSLQLWWNKYSLPLYEMKLKRDFDSFPSLIFIIYLLALQFKLPWGTDLYHRCGCFRKEPQMALLAYLVQFVIILDKNNQTIQIVPGPKSAGNIKGLKRGVSEYRYSHFGKVQYTTLYQNKVQKLKIDKEVILNHHKDQNLIKIIPNIMPAELNRFRANYIVIQLDENNYQIPLIWKKAELIIPGYRIRWIFKKDRFQLTCQMKKKGSLLKIDEKVINPNDSQKVIHYYPLIKSESHAVIKLFSSSGRSFFLDHELFNSDARVVGWIQDRYGLFMDDLNIRLNTQLIHYKVQESGMIHMSIPIFSKLDIIQIRTKRIENKIRIQKISNNVCLKLMGYSHRESKGMFLMIVIDHMTTPLEELMQLFLQHLGFVPLVLYNSEINKKHSADYKIYLDRANDLYTFKKNNDYSNALILSSNYPEEIRKLYTILSEYRENL